MLTAAYVHVNDTRKSQHSNGEKTMAMIDYTNLYIKNLDPEVTSHDLFKKFRFYGKIISARVMKDTITGVSKGYGFVSFTHMDEANEALQQMNGALVNSKHIVVTFHTHKKSFNNNNKQSKHRSTDLINLSPPSTASTTLPQQQQHQHQYMYPTQQPSPPYPSHHPAYGFSTSDIPTKPTATTSTSHTISQNNPWDDTGIWMHHNNKSPPVHAYSTSSMHVPSNVQTTNAPILVSPSTSPSQPQSHLIEPMYYQQQDTSQIQIQKLREAISLQLKDYQQKDLNDLVDLIQSLKKRDLSLCLFNPIFLKQKIDEAYEALYLFQNPVQPSSTTTPSLVHPNLVIEDQPQQPQQQPQPQPQQQQQQQSEINSASVILSQLEGMTMNKKKRVFGDIFFPYVRATGVKHAPKVTIRLLDTVPLEELAYNMYDKQELTRKAQFTYAQLYSTNTTITNSNADSSNHHHNGNKNEIVY